MMIRTCNHIDWDLNKKKKKKIHLLQVHIQVLFIFKRNKDLLSRQRYLQTIFLSNPFKRILLPAMQQSLPIYNEHNTRVCYTYT